MAMRAKSKTVSVTWKVPESAIAEADVVAAVVLEDVTFDDVVDEVVACEVVDEVILEESAENVADAEGVVVVVVSVVVKIVVEGAAVAMVVRDPAASRTTLALAESSATGTTISLAVPTRVLNPSYVTRAFSEIHERLAPLKRCRRVVATSGIEKLVCAEEMRRGIDSPRVTLASCALRVVTVQPVEPPTVHVFPVNPFMHIQAQFPLDKNVVPPF